MAHPEFVSLANLYAMGALTGNDLSRFERHLAECEACRTAVRDLRQTSDDLGLAPPPRMSPLPQRGPAPAVAKPRRFRWRLAVLVLAALLGLLFLLYRAR